MVEFMITDLRQDLEPVGKLDILDSVGGRVTDYYDAIPLPDMDDDRLARQARARHILGQVALDQGDMDKAQSEIQTAYDATQEKAAWGQNNLGKIKNLSKEYEPALGHFISAIHIFKKASQFNPQNDGISFELANAFAGACRAAIQEEDLRNAKVYCFKQIEIYDQLLAKAPNNYGLRFRHAQALRYYAMVFETNPKTRLYKTQNGLIYIKS